MGTSLLDAECEADKAIRAVFAAETERLGYLPVNPSHSHEK